MDFQSTLPQIVRQQVILKLFSFYKGPIDGIWGPECIEAKKAFENSREKFRPGIPNNGLPFGNERPYPLGIYRNSLTGLLECDGIEKYASEEAAALKPKEAVAQVSVKSSAQNKPGKTEGSASTSASASVSALGDNLPVATSTNSEDSTSSEVSFESRTHKGKHR